MKPTQKIMHQLLYFFTVLIVTCIFILTPVTSEAAKKKTSTLESMINAAPLTPTPTGSASADAYVASLLAQLTTPQMTTYQKVKVVYDYLINHTFYDQIIEAGIQVPWDVRNAKDYGTYVGYSTLVSGHGVCDTYACAFSMIMRYMGLNSYVVGGQTHKTSGGYTPHAWSVILLNGEEYIFDAQIDDNIAKGGKIGYHRFGKTLAQVSDKYIRSEVAFYYKPLMQQTPVTPVATGLVDDFDHNFYALVYPDVVAAFGKDPAALYNHYLSYGKKEGRWPNLSAVPGF